MNKWYLSQECKGDSTLKKNKPINKMHHTNRQKAHSYLNGVEEAFKQNPILFHNKNTKTKTK